MEKFVVSARKYRPDTFDSVLGQKPITNTLKNAIQNNHLAQAFLFCGPRGVGKTTCARILAKSINCFDRKEGAEPCNSCESCKGFNGNHSFNIHELDAASNNGVDKIRDLVDQVRFAPQIGSYSVYIIDEVHMLSQAAFNAFLKTLEEPPSHAIFILATTEKHKIIPTILSRCQIFDFKRIQIKEIVTQLEHICKQEKIQSENDALHIIAQKANGGLRDALSIFDQAATFCHNNITYESVIENLNILDYDYFFKITESILKNDVSESLNIFNNILINGFDGNNFVNGLANHFRDLLVCKDPSTIQLLEVGENIKEKYRDQANQFNTSKIIKGLELCNQADLAYKNSNNQRLLIEIALIQLCDLDGLNSEKKKTRSKVIENDKKPVKLNKEEEESIKETTKINNQKIVPKRTISINLDHLEEEEEEEEEEVIENPFSNEDLEASWKNYVTNISLQGKHNLSSIIKDKTPILKEGFTIEINLQNDVQKQIFEEEKVKILSFLKKELLNNSISLNTKIIPTEKRQKKAYTQEEKFKEMADKNPVLIQMKQNFDLEIDY